MVNNMKKYFKKFKIEQLLYLFIIIAPILDAGSFLYKQAFPNSTITPTMIIRTSIPFILFIYMMIKVPKERKKLIVFTILATLYGIIHLLLVKKLILPISIGNIIQEANYIINYTYMVYLLMIFIYFKNEKDLKYLSNSLIISLGIYLFIIYFSIITGTSYSTYVEGMGYKSYFVSGNSLCTTLLMLITVLLTGLKNKKIINYVLLVLSGIYLIFLVGTRTGMFGFILLMCAYLGLYILDKLFRNKKIETKKILSIIGASAVVILLIGYFGSETITRRAHIKEESNEIIDINTNKAGHTTGDTAKFVYEIRNNTMDESLMTNEQRQAYLSMYDTCNKLKINANDSRAQQLIYHSYLIKHQHNILYILFGNGFIVNYGEMTLEMEIIAILFNFGLFGFILYIIPFIYVYIKLIKQVIKNKKRTIDDIIMLFTMLIVFGLSFMAGYVFFSGTCVLMLISMMSLIYKER